MIRRLLDDIRRPDKVIFIGADVAEAIRIRNDDRGDETLLFGRARRQLSPGAAAAESGGRDPQQLPSAPVGRALP